MSWVNLGEINLTHDWSFTPPVMGEVFRIIHKPVNNIENKYLKAVIAQGFVDEKLNIFNPQRLSYRLESEIFTFYFPAGIAQQKLCLKRLDDTDIDWIIEAEVYQATNALEELSNYLKARFGETTIMDYLIDRTAASKSVSPVTFTGNMKVATVESLAGANQDRMHLIIRAGDKAINLYAGKSATGNGENLIEKVNPLQIFILPNQGGIYKGTVYCQCIGGDSTVSVTEYS
jgi:hypothetical protein